MEYYVTVFCYHCLILMFGVFNYISANLYPYKEPVWGSFKIRIQSMDPGLSNYIHTIDMLCRFN